MSRIGELADHVARAGGGEIAMFERIKAAAVEWWAQWSIYLIVPAGIVAWCILVYVMFHDML